jgi:hypothetical protein
MATGVNACVRIISHLLSTPPQKEATHLEHLNVRHAQIQIRRIAQNQAPRKEHPNRQNRTDKHILAHLHLLRPIQQPRRPLQNPRARSRKRQMERHQKDGILEVEGVVQIIVVYNHAGAEDDPDGDDGAC